MDESRRAVAHVPSVRMYCKGYGAVRGASVSSCVLLCCFVAGALRRSHTEGRQPPNPKGWTSRSRRTSHLDRPPGRPCRESPGLFVLSLSHSSKCNRQWVVNPPAQFLWIATRQHLWAIDVCTRAGRASRCGPTLPQARLHALLNACAAGRVDRRW